MGPDSVHKLLPRVGKMRGKTGWRGQVDWSLREGQEVGSSWVRIWMTQKSPAILAGSRCLDAVCLLEVTSFREILP